MVAVFFDPMNLTTHTLEGMLKHTRFDFEPYDSAGIQRENPFAEVRVPGRGQRNHNDPLKYCGQKGSDGKMSFDCPASYEGQVVDIADEIAYISHDVADLLTRDVIKDEDLPEEWLVRFGDDPANEIDELVTGVIQQNWQGVAQKTSKGKAYEIKHPVELDCLVTLMKGWFHDHVYGGNDAQNAKDMIAALFDYVLKNPRDARRLSIFADRIVRRGFKGKRLAGHVVASMTDIEAREAYESLC